MALSKRKLALACVLVATVATAQDKEIEDKQFAIWKKNMEATHLRQEQNYKKVMDARVDELIRLCDLDDEQVKRLRLASKGAVEYCLEAYRDFQEKQWLRQRNKGNVVGIVRLEPKDQNPALQSVWLDTIADQLNPEQKQIFEEEMQARLKFYMDTAVHQIIQQLDQQYRLSAKQRAVLMETINQSIDAPADEGMNGPSTGSIAVYKGLAKVPDEPLREVLSPDQFKEWKVFRDRYAQIYKNR